MRAIAVVAQRRICRLRDQIVVDLSAAQDQPLDLRSRSSARGSSITGANVPSAISSSVPDALSARSSDFGVMTTSGTAIGERACMRSK